MCNKVVDDFLQALKFVTNKFIKKLLTAIYYTFFDEYYGNATFFCNQMGILSTDLNINSFKLNCY